MALSILKQKYQSIKTKGIFAKWYDKNTKKNRIDEIREYVNVVDRFLPEHANVLEIAPGNGYFAIELAKKGEFKIVGLDMSLDFVNICRENAIKEKVNIDFIQGNVSEMPFFENSFDFVFCSCSFHHFNEPIIALSEIHRVLKKGGICLIVDKINEPSKNKKNISMHRTVLASFTNFFFTNILKKTYNSAYSKNELEYMIKQIAFKKFTIKEERTQIHIYLYK